MNPSQSTKNQTGPPEPQTTNLLHRPMMEVLPRLRKSYFLLLCSSSQGHLLPAVWKQFPGPVNFFPACSSCRMTGERVSSVTSVLLASRAPAPGEFNSCALHPQANAEEGMFSWAYLTATILPSMPRSPKPTGNQNAVHAVQLYYQRCFIFFQVFRVGLGNAYRIVRRPRY